ncbi:hypothetical protein Nhal_3257 [Nitrosococcus halophilus Nc 4]|uniref:Uncharacterized protein n=1 Tax=Nitrosococcus halophilus (strain Nc4) TaxID=472759 RepID=D5C058_NITHN|nr:hypothetical protein Nhal_3257 [Nitrosococcus halophilus Nc 4]
MKGRLSLSVAGNDLAGNGLKALLMRALSLARPLRAFCGGPASLPANRSGLRGGANKQPVGRIKRRVSGKTILPRHKGHESKGI